MLHFSRVDDGAVLLRQTGLVPPAAATGGSATFDFSSSATSVYGMGQNRPGQGMCDGLFCMYNTRSMDVRDQHFNFAETMGNEGGPTNSAPFVVGGSNTTGFSFGLLFNSPAFGGMDFTNTTLTCSTAPDSATGGNGTIRKMLDFLIVTSASGSPPSQRAFDISGAYTAAVGRAPKMPDWGSKYWHCKNRYSNQTQLLTAARYFHQHNLSVGVLVIDWFHWRVMGDWSFDPKYWPDPKAMVEECKSYGIEVMASVWPFTCETSRSYNTTVSQGYVASDSNGKPFQYGMGGKNCRLVDPTNPLFAQYAWGLLRESYYKYGIKIFWLDNSEPWHAPKDSYFGKPSVDGSSGYSYADSGALFDVAWPKVIHDGLVSEGETDVVMLPRAGWIGTWKYGGALVSTILLKLCSIFQCVSARYLTLLLLTHHTACLHSGRAISAVLCLSLQRISRR
jgi:alpha-D-xyloside xylohydrolase